MPTEWEEFRMPDLAEFKKLLKEPVIFDGKNIYRRSSFLVEQMQKLGFDYFGVGTKRLFRK